MTPLVGERRPTGASLLQGGITEFVCQKPLVSTDTGEILARLASLGKQKEKVTAQHPLSLQPVEIIGCEKIDRTKNDENRVKKRKNRLTFKYAHL